MLHPRARLAPCLVLLSVAFVLSVFASFHALRAHSVAPYQNIDLLSSRELDDRLSECALGLLSEPVRSNPEIFSFFTMDCDNLAATAATKIGTRSNALVVSAISALNTDAPVLAISLLRQSQATEPNTFWLARIRLLVWNEVGKLQDNCGEQALLSDLILIRNAPQRQAFDVTGICNDG
mgnify:FL=1